MIAAVEDVLSEAIVRKLILSTRPDLEVSSVLRRNGRNYIQSRINELNRTARSQDVFVLVDLDRPIPCPADLIESWLPASRAPKLLFRVAVMECESWVMADRDAFSSFLSVPLHRLPVNPDIIGQPKEFIVSLARRSKRKEIREDLVPSPGDTRIVGPGFNARLASFITDIWDAERASPASDSLRKTVDRLRTAFGGVKRRSGVTE